MTTNYARGRAFEYKTRDFLYAAGAKYVIRAAGSHTVCDLVAFFPYGEYQAGAIYFVQCKRDGKLPEREKQELIELAHAVNAFPYLASQGGRGNPVVLERLHKEVNYSGSK